MSGAVHEEKRREQASMLLVDDDPAKLFALRSLLEPLGHEIVDATSGEEALRRLLRQDFAVILLDVRMPGLDGYETAQLIRMREQSRLTPIIFVTAFDRAETEMSRGYALGAVDFVFTPIAAEMLRAKVTVFVELYRKTQQLASTAQRNAELLAEAREASRTKSEFLNMAAHELRTPLSVIRGYVSMLEDGSLGRAPDAWHGPIDVVSQKAAELSALVEDLLVAARVEANRIPAELTRMDLRAAALAALQRAAPRSTMAEAEILYDAPPEEVPVNADEKHLARILDNLLNNALSYQERKPWVRMVVAASPEPHVMVEDHGIGVPPMLRERIFESFFRVEDPRLGPQSGTGLGLYISRGLAERHGGSLTLRWSQPGKGSGFVLWLPPAPDRAAPVRSEVNGGRARDSRKRPRGGARARPAAEAASPKPR